jgi:trehalose/maltose transport system permease protein
MSNNGGGPSELAKQEARLARLLLLPSIIILLVVAVYPLGDTFFASFTNRQFAGGETTDQTFVGLSNYRQLLGMTIKELKPVRVTLENEIVYERAIDVLPREPHLYRQVTQFTLFGRRFVLGAREPDFILAVKDTMIYTVASVILETILGLGIAMVVNSKFRGRGLMRAAMLVPWAIPTVVSARLWGWMLRPTRVGLFNTLFSAIGIGGGNISFLTNKSLQLPVLIAVDVWKTTPFMALMLLAGLQMISQDLYEAADVDGAGKVRQFLSITLPLLRPSLAVALVFRTLDALRAFDVFNVLLSRQRLSMASFTYEQLIQFQTAGLSSASGVLIFLLIFAFAVLYVQLLGVET